MASCLLNDTQTVVPSESHDANDLKKTQILSGDISFSRSHEILCSDVEGDVDEQQTETLEMPQISTENILEESTGPIPAT